MYSYGTKEFILSEAHGFAGPFRFTCPRCNAKPRDYCRRAGGYQTVRVHKERDALWTAWKSGAPEKLAWLESMALPYFLLVIEDYLIGGKRPKRRRVDIQIAQKRLQEAKILLEDQ